MTLALSWSCFHAPTPYLPGHWPGAASPPDTLADRPDKPVLQVIIAYNSHWPNHTALRMVDDTGKPIFWDPAGGYGKTTAHIVRHSGLIIDNAPDLATYLVFRWANNDQAVEIFEWDLSPSEARRLADTLIAGAARTDFSNKGFRTATAGLFCNAAVSGFLYDFGRPAIAVRDYYLLPNLLSGELYQSHPDRVMILRRDTRPQVLVLKPPQIRRDLAERD